MRALLALVLLTACGGPTQNQLAETPSATTRRPPSVAPPASTSDRDRERSVQQFEDMETTQRAYREAGQQRQQDPTKGYRPPGSGKKAPVEQAPVESRPPPGVPPATPTAPATPPVDAGSAAPTPSPR